MTGAERKAARSHEDPTGNSIAVAGSSLYPLLADTVSAGRGGCGQSGGHILGCTHSIHQ